MWPGFRNAGCLSPVVGLGLFGSRYGEQAAPRIVEVGWLVVLWLVGSRGGVQPSAASAEPSFKESSCLFPQLILCCQVKSEKLIRVRVTVCPAC